MQYRCLSTHSLLEGILERDCFLYENVKIKKSSQFWKVQANSLSTETNFFCTCSKQFFTLFSILWNLLLQKSKTTNFIPFSFFGWIRDKHPGFATLRPNKFHLLLKLPLWTAGWAFLYLPKLLPSPAVSAAPGSPSTAASPSRLPLLNTLCNSREESSQERWQSQYSCITTPSSITQHHFLQLKIRKLTRKNLIVS